jgi:hypothetical protein
MDVIFHVLVDLTLSTLGFQTVNFVSFDGPGLMDCPPCCSSGQLIRILKRKKMKEKRYQSRVPLVLENICLFVHTSGAAVLSTMKGKEYFLVCKVESP